MLRVIGKFSILFVTFLIFESISLTITHAQQVDRCSPVNNKTEVHAQASVYTCSDLRSAIEQALPGGIIRLHNGVYTFPKNYSLIIDKDLNIYGSSSLLLDRPASNFTELVFDNNNDYGLTITNQANVTVSNLVITSKNQGILYAQNAGRVNFYNNYFDGGASSIGIYNSLDSQISGNTIVNSNLPIEIQHVPTNKIHHNTIKNSNRGILLLDSSASVVSNLIENSGVQNASIYAKQSLGLAIINNTIVQNTESNYEYAIDLISTIKPVNLSRNIVTGDFFGMRSDATPETLLDIKENNFFNTKANYTILSDQTGKNGNISADPQFGNNYCLNVNSPSVLEHGAFMGFKGLCNYVSPTPDYRNPLSRVDIQPASLEIEVNSNPIEFSAEAVLRAGGNSNEISYEWGMSSLGSIGILTQNKDNQKLAKFTPIKPGNADVWVIARIGDFMVQRSVLVEVKKVCRMKDSCTSDACIQIVPPGGWCASEELPGDVDFNNSVNYQDVIKFKASFDKKFYPADFNFDGKVNIYDFLMLVKNFGLSLDVLDDPIEVIPETEGAN
jgi:hypothetical protein